VYVSYLSMGFPDIGIKKHQGQHRRENLWLLSKVDGDCVTPHGLTAYHLFLGSYFKATLTNGMARSTDTLWSSSELFFPRHLPEFIGNMPTLTTTRAFVGYLSFFSRKSSGKQIHAKTIWLKKCFNFFMFRDVPECSGMFRNVPECSWMFHVPDFIDALLLALAELDRCVSE